MRRSRGWVGVGGPTPPPLKFAKLNIADITGNEKIIYFSYLCTSTVIRQTEPILLKVGPPPLEKFSGSAPDMHMFLSPPHQSKLSIVFLSVVVDCKSQR